jgi:hypothetical protein
MVPLTGARVKEPAPQRMREGDAEAATDDAAEGGNEPGQA